MATGHLRIIFRDACQKFYSTEYCSRRLKFYEKHNYITSNCTIEAPLAKKLMQGFEDKDGSQQLKELILAILIRRSAEIKFIRENIEKTQFEADEEIYKNMIISLIDENFPLLPTCSSILLDEVENL